MGGVTGAWGHTTIECGIRGMQMAFYSIPARGDSGLQEDLNRFLRSHWVLTVHLSPQVFWSMDYDWGARGTACSI